MDGRFVFCLRAGDERADVAPQIEGASRAVTEAALDANLFIEPRRVAAAKNRVRHLRDAVGRIDTPDPRPRHHHRGLSPFGHVDHHHPVEGRQSCLPDRRDRLSSTPSSKQLLRESERVFRGDVAAEDEDRVFRPVVALVKSEDVDLRDARQRLRRAAEVMTVRRDAEENARGDESREIARLMHRHLQRVEILRAQPFDFVLCEQRILNDIGEVAERFGEIR